MFVFNIDKKGYPAPGAPVPKWGGAQYPNLCSVCFEMQLVLETRMYWVDLHNAWKRLMEKSKRQMGEGGDYLAR